MTSQMPQTIPSILEGRLGLAQSIVISINLIWINEYGCAFVRFKLLNDKLDKQILNQDTRQHLPQLEALALTWEKTMRDAQKIARRYASASFLALLDLSQQALFPPPVETKRSKLFFRNIISLLQIR